jgi:hypothetical protein
MKCIVPLAAAAALATIAVTGCSTGGLPGASAATGSVATIGGASPATITGKDLITILNRVAEGRGISTSKVVGLADSKAYVKRDISGPYSTTITKNLTVAGGWLKPSACKPILNALGLVGEKKIASAGWQGSALVVGKDQISVASAPAAAGATGFVTETAALVGRLQSACPTMHVKNGSLTSTFVVKEIAATTHGSRTIAYEELQRFSDPTISAETDETMETSEGNLVVIVLSAKPDASRMEALANATLAAAGKN